MSESDILDMRLRRRANLPEKEHDRSTAMMSCSVAFGCALAWMILRDKNKGIEL